MTADRELTCFRPAGIQNPYIKNVRSALRADGYETRDLKEILFHPGRFIRCRIFNFNFFENLESKKEYYAKTVILMLLKICRKKIIFTMHNKQAHQGAMRPLSIKMMKRLCRYADVIVGLCPDTEAAISAIAPGCEKKLTVIPHPNYIDEIPEGNDYLEASRINRRDEIRRKWHLREDDILLLSVGFVMPYKNYEMVIDTVKASSNPRLHLLIAGKPKPAAYGDEIKKLAAECPNIHLQLEYLSEEELVALYQAADVSVLPYHTESSLNSGAIYMSFSMKKTVICPDIGTVHMIPDPSFAYHYSYDSEEEHRKKLKEQIEKLLDETDKDAANLQKKGELAYDYVTDKHSLETVAASYQVLYDRLSNK